MTLPRQSNGPKKAAVEKSAIYRTKASIIEQVLAGGGEMGERMRAFDWSQTPLGEVSTWPQSLKTAVRIMLTSRQPFWLGWGEQLIKLYNDPYKAIAGGKHPHALGQPAAVVWREIWDEIGPMLKTAMSGVEGTYVEAQLLIMERNGYPEETYYTFSYSPIPNDEGGVGGIICANTDNTDQIIGERQLALLRELAVKTADARTVEEACALSTACLRTNPYDLPFAMIYLVEPDARHAVLAANEHGQAVAPATVALDSTAVWPLAEVLATNQAGLISDLSAFAGNLPMGAWDRPPHQAVAIPITFQGRMGKAGILVVGLNPYRLFDEKYRGFLELAAAQIAASIANAQAYEEERQRAESLAELDRAKTAFFSNISHEFRTPLTLMLGPLEDLLQQVDGTLPPEQREQLEVAHRNSLRLLKLVNTLLDFSRIEAGRIQASYEPTDLSAFTAELASVFRSAIERAGLRFVVNCPPLAETVDVDREMWEKIVLNLLSNAFKFTFRGEIEVSLRPAGAMAELTVRDTGTGIPAEEIPHLFERFHRVRGATGRTFEGSGIGLALVQELVKLHGGAVRVESEVGSGSRFIVSIPLVQKSLPADSIRPASPSALSGLPGQAYVEEALRWLPSLDDPLTQRQGDSEIEINDSSLSPSPAAPARILLADDNTDMREYVRRLLSQEYEVVPVSDGLAAWQAAQEKPFDLVLTDVMMPGLDGLELLRQLRADERTREVSVILLSARAGEEARVEGIEAGADDYLIKPFSARELMAHVRANLELARIRRQAARREHVLRTEAERVRERLERILAGIQDDFVMYDDEWRYVYVNDQAAQSLGYPQEYLLGQCIWELFPEAVGNLFYREMLRAKAEGREVTFEHYYEPWGKWIENRAYPLPEGMLLFAADITERKRVEVAERLLAEMRERNRLAQDLHDTVAQALGYLNLKTTITHSQLANNQIEVAKASLHELKQVIEETYTDVREEIFNLRAKVLTGMGFMEVLNRYIDKYRRFYSLDIQLVQEVDPALFHFPPEATSQLIRTIQEALINIRKHARVDRAIIRLSQENGQICIRVEDQGQGFDLNAAKEKTASFGLQIMRERVESIGGSLEVETAPSQGTQIIVRYRH